MSNNEHNTNTKPNNKQKQQTTHNQRKSTSKLDSLDSTNLDSTSLDTDLNIDLNIAMVQAQFLVGDIKGNVKKIKQMAVQAREQGADIVVFPEMALMGSPAEDLLLRPNLANRIKTALEDISTITNIVILVGYPHIDHNGIFNSIAILHEGQRKGFYHKQCLSNYGIFDERRYFTKGRNQVLFDYKGVHIGLLICEDLWQKEPISRLKEQGADIVITLNASPFEVDKQIIRQELLVKRATENELPIIYVNSVGGQDDLVFDGGSMVVNSKGEIVYEAPRFLQQLLLTQYQIADKDFCKQQKTPLVLSQESEIYQALVVGLRDYVNNSGFNGVIVGLSGGIDSALTLCIAVDALGADRVYAVMLPYKYTSQISLEDAQAQANRLNVSYTVCPIFDAIDGIRHTLAPLFAGKSDDTTEENIQARARGMVLMALSNKFGHLVITTGNKSELAIGNSTLYGDMVGGFDVLKDIYKTKIYELANYRNRLEEVPVIPERVLTREPSAELRPKQSDSDSLPDYQTLDAILELYIDNDMSYQDIVDKGFDPALTAQIMHRVNNSEYKRRQSAIGTKVSHKALERERRYPLVNGWAVQD